MEKAFILTYTCVTANGNETLESELEYIQENDSEISFKDFLSSVSQTSFNQLARSLGYSKDFKLEEDRYVTYHKSFNKENEVVYFLRHSCIEYVFKEGFDAPEDLENDW
ncbi:hypothetical protein U8V72_20240 [Priestia filamentosa]|uniref:hypothetical protein n=1 Tax=Priestia filamentosa TaxID=1402861 RepID=UPI00058925A4